MSSRPLLTPQPRKPLSSRRSKSFSRKRTENVTDGVLKKYTRELARLRTFFEGKSKFLPEDIALADLEKFRADWLEVYKSTYTRAKVQERLRGFLNCCHEAGWLARVPKLSAIKIVEPPTLPLTVKEFEICWRRFRQYSRTSRSR